MSLLQRAPYWRRRRAGAPAIDPLEDQLALLELRVSRIADLVLKVNCLLEPGRTTSTDPRRAERVARVTWVLEHGRAALQEAASTPAPGRAPAPRRAP